MLTFAFWLCLVLSQPTEQQAVSLLSQPRTRHVWIRSICRSWLSWERLQSPPLEEDIPAPREGHLGLQDPTITSLHQSVGNTFHSFFWSRQLSWPTAISFLAAQPTSLDELWSSRQQKLPRHAWRPWWTRRTSQLPSPHAQYGRTSYAPQPKWHASTMDAAPSSSHGPESRTSWTPYW